MEQVLLQILDIFEQKLGIDKQKLSPELSFADLGLDEIDKIMLLVCLEDAFQIMINDHEFSKVDSINSLVTFMSNSLRGHARQHEVIGL